MMNNSRKPYFYPLSFLLIFIILVVIVYYNGMLQTHSQYEDFSETQYFQFLATEKYTLSRIYNHLIEDTHEDYDEVIRMLQEIIEEQPETEHIHAQFAILDNKGIFIHHPIYNGKSLEYIKDNFDAQIYQTIYNTEEGILKVPVNPYKKELSQMIYYTTLQETDWSLMLIEDRSSFNAIETFRRQVFKISALTLSALLGILCYAYYRTLKHLNHTLDMNENLENIVHDRTIAIMTNNRELEYALKDAEESKERMIQSNEELNQMIHQIQETQEKLVESEKLASLGSIVAGVAHEINTPLGTALTSATFLEELIKDAENEFINNRLTKRRFSGFISDIKDSCHMLIDSIFRTSQLVQSFKQIAVDQSDTQLLAFNLCDYLNKIVLSLKHEYKNTSHKIKIHCSGKVEIESFPGAFAQIFTNLIMNSLTHGFENVIEGMILIDIKKIDSNLFIIYSDNGKGISKSDLKRIFDPFFTTKRGAGGSGLGMNIVYNLVTQKLGGTIQVKSERNNGVKFIMQIPVKTHP